MPPFAPLRAGRLAGGIVAALAVVSLLDAPRLGGQVPAEPVLRGRVLVGDSVLSSGTVVLHHLTSESQGEVDSTLVARDGSFAFRLPSVPDPRSSEMYFASVRHQGVLYFGGAVTLPVQLDSLYEIRTYDTAYVADGTGTARLQARFLFLEEVEDRWRVTDLFQLVNERARTLVAGEGSAVWSHPLPAEAEDPTVGSGDFAAGGARFVSGSFQVTSPIPPGERMFVIRYFVPAVFLEVPMPDAPGALEVLVKEPAPPVEVPGLRALGSAELETGSTYLRFASEEPHAGPLRIVPGEEVRPPPVRWLAVAVALLLAGVAAVVAARARPARTSAAPARGGASPERELLLEIARLDEEFEAAGEVDASSTERYRRRRAELLRRLRELG